MAVWTRSASRGARVVTAVGGGTLIRDMALDNGPVFWLKILPISGRRHGHQYADHLLLVRQPRRLPKWMLPVLDAVGLAVFCRHWGE